MAFKKQAVINWCDSKWYISLLLYNMYKYCAEVFFLAVNFNQNNNTLDTHA